MAVPGELLLTDEDFEELQRLLSVYRREAAKCENGGSYLGGCIMLGAALEASLMAMVHCFPEEVQTADSCPTRKGRPMTLMHWKFGELLSVANELSWLPARLTREGEFEAKLAAIGDYAEVVRQMRDLVHPARYIQDLPRKRITKKYLDTANEVLKLATDYLLDILVKKIKVALPDER
jgi:hypothetical protein